MAAAQGSLDSQTSKGGDLDRDDSEGLASGKRKQEKTRSPPTDLTKSDLLLLSNVVECFWNLYANLVKAF